MQHALCDVEPGMVAYTDMLMAYIVMAYIPMAYIAMAYVVTACIVMAYIVMAWTFVHKHCRHVRRHVMSHRTKRAFVEACVWTCV